MPPAPIRCLPLLLLVLAPGLSAAAQPPIDERVVALDHPDYRERLRANELLLSDPTITADQIAAWSRAELTDEQRHRLLIVARHHTLGELRREEFPAPGPGAIGIRHGLGGQNGSQSIRVIQVMPGFPGFGRLRHDDAVLSVDGEKFEGGAGLHERFLARMIGCRAGQEIRMAVRRGDKQLQITIPLANADALHEMYPDQRVNKGSSLAPRFEDRWQEVQRTVYQDLLPQPDTFKP